MWGRAEAEAYTSDWYPIGIAPTWDPEEASESARAQAQAHAQHGHRYGSVLQVLGSCAGSGFYFEAEAYRIRASLNLHLGLHLGWAVV